MLAHFLSTYSFAARIRRPPPPHVRTSLSAIPDLLSRGPSLYVRLQTFLSCRAAGALQFRRPARHLDKWPSRFVDSNASIQANTNIKEKWKGRTISTPIQEPIKLTFVSFSDVLPLKRLQAKTPVPNAEKTTHEQLRLPVKRPECKNSSQMINTTHSRTSTYHLTIPEDSGSSTLGGKLPFEPAVQSSG